MSTTDHHCPACGIASLRRCGRKGPWEEYVLPVFGIFPWRCFRCRARYRLSDRGEGYLRVRGGEKELQKDLTE